MPIIKSVFSFLVVLFLSSSLLAQEYLEGTVFEAGEVDRATPIPGVNVYFVDFDGGTITNPEGYFKIEIPEGAHQVVFSFVGLKNDTLHVHDLKNPVSIVMRDGDILPDVVVKGGSDGYRFEKFNPRDAHIMNEGELRKAACCNISESFETNPAIDANFTDAVTGTKQIQMLGLSGRYVQMMQDNIPMSRGLSTIYGLEFIPGAWVNSIQISKGAGSVVNGYESMTGQINIGMKNPETGEPLHVNVYSNTALRNELNIHSTFRVNKRWRSTVLGHAKYAGAKFDRNGDSFLDRPLSNTFIVQNQWNYSGPVLHSELGIGVVSLDNRAGQYSEAFDANVDFAPEIYTNPYRVHSYSGKVNAFAKIGYLFPQERYKSIAIQLNGSYHNQLGNFGYRHYGGEQASGYANLIFQDEIGEGDVHKYKTGASLIYDDYREETKKIQTTDTSYHWTEVVPGAYFEYSLNKTLFSMVAGIRADYHNIYGPFVTPRLNARWSLTEKTAFKFAAGMGRRTPNVFMENVGALASSRTWVINGTSSSPVYGLDQEIAANFGVSFNQDLKIGGEEANLNIDFYHSRFVNQIVADYDYSTRELHLYNLNGESFSNSAQVEFNFKPIKRLDVRMAYRWLDVRTQYLTGVLQQPLTAKHRGFVNVAKETRKNKHGSYWKFDITAQWVGQQRLPQTLDNPEVYQRSGTSDDYVLLNSQVTYLLRDKWEFYLGGENLTNFKLANPIVAASDPFSEYFDASMVWGPVFGRMIYLGARFTIK
ncbi:TonB-dependent receptor [Parvicella tangerina]|uniref:TonB-dependent receptor plug domain-containing protein n=1 Tax=Parvicella tangerina TaxID=2829795 RepID=A0A916JK43_9FLAO|nr:TonB-dependent receptor [Parvicella tangerina]CAG5077087.1 hypothetical protein CRYO30217_00287 [Parvicella tangerina]